ncbi:hypothetical protein BaRGS_00040382 [Batillaria attramentaria]|uniref:Uncharacterized protein n=1 Tax=Batillaria attramentaria TaxID=370345 RepID=A0ABD0J0H4_9CAEN
MWVDEEFKLLRDTVHTMVTSNPTPQSQEVSNGDDTAHNVSGQDDKPEDDDTPGQLDSDGLPSTLNTNQTGPPPSLDDATTIPPSQEICILKTIGVVDRILCSERHCAQCSAVIVI